MKLITAHRILIGAAITFFLFYAVVAVVHGRPGALVQAAVAVGIAIGLGFYYRSLSLRWGPRHGPDAPDRSEPPRRSRGGPR